MLIKPAVRIRGEITVPGDKSISHRSVMFGSIANGKTVIKGFLNGADCLSTIDCFRKMGVSIDVNGDCVTVHGKGMHGLRDPKGVLDVGNSGTTMRLIAGILAPQNFDVTLTGDDSIRKRPMNRIIDPLSLMGAEIWSIPGNGCAPLKINGSPLAGINYKTPVASAQVKSCIILAGLYAEGRTTVTEPAPSRNHTELMLKYFGAQIKSDGNRITVYPPGELHGGKTIKIPGDISSAVYFVAAGLILPNSEVLIKNVGINPTRAGLLTVCKDMGADITVLNEDHSSAEPVADLLVRSSSLKGTVIGGDIVPTMIDELPTVAMMACFAEGQTVIKDASELRVKESDRIAIMEENLRLMGADVTATDDGLIINGGKPLHGATIDTHKDHRIAMTFAIAALAAEGETELLDADCVDISYPDFFKDLEKLTK